MGDHVVLHVNRLLTPQTIGTTTGVDGSMSFAEAAYCFAHTHPSTSIASSCNDQKGKEESTVGEEYDPLIQMVDCRICQEEDHIKNLEAPCACSGSLKYAHRACVQRWCSEKGDITCEICREQYKPGYIAPPQVHSDETMINVNWVITGSQLNLHDPRVLATTTSRGHLVEAEYAELATDSSGAACFRSAALILMTILLLRHALIITNSDGDDDYDDDASTYFSLFLLRVVGILLPCYIMVWIISILQQWRQRQEAAAALAATQVSFNLQSGQ